VLQGYGLPNADRRVAALERRRREYWDLVAQVRTSLSPLSTDQERLTPCLPWNKQHYDVPDVARTDDEAATLRQIGAPADDDSHTENQSITPFY
jgi:hypothetical protein